MHSFLQVHLIGVVASNPDNTPALRLHLLHHQLAALIKAAAVPAGPSGPPQELIEIAVLATGTACALLARRYAFGRRWKIDSSVAASFVDAGVFVAATAFAQYSSMQCQHFGLRLLLLGLESDIPQVRSYSCTLVVLPVRKVRWTHVFRTSAWLVTSRNVSAGEEAHSRIGSGAIGVATAAGSCRESSQ